MLRPSVGGLRTKTPPFPLQVICTGQETALVHTSCKTRKKKQVHAGGQAPEICKTGDVRISQHHHHNKLPENGKAVYPEIVYSGHFYPICAHEFASNNYGATIFCQKLGFSSGEAQKTGAAFDKDAMPVGKCGSGEELTACTKGGNAWGKFVQLGAG